MIETKIIITATEEEGKGMGIHVEGPPNTLIMLALLEIAKAQILDGTIHPAAPPEEKKAIVLPPPGMSVDQMRVLRKN